MGDFKSTRDYKLHEKIHREFIINEASLDLLNMARIEEILEMISKKYHLDAMVKIETIKYQEYVDNPVDALKERIQWVTFGDTNVKPTKANIKRHRNNVKCLCDFLQINEPVMTSYMIDAFKNCFYICKTDYKILLAELKPSDTETMEYLDKKIKSMETK